MGKLHIGAGPIMTAKIYWLR